MSIRIFNEVTVVKLQVSEIPLISLFRINAVNLTYGVVNKEMTNTKQARGQRDHAPDPTIAGGGIHVVAKPIGPVCNLTCEYCFYLEKKALFGPGEQHRMSDKVLSAFITNYITSQSTPIVERLPDERSRKSDLRLAGPASLDKEEQQTEVTSWSVIPEEYGDFLIAIYEEWVRQDVGKVFVMNFEWALNAWMGDPSPVCVHARQCGRSLVMEAVKGPLVIKQENRGTGG
jgi:sulfatase maturation enzyme AslB (radical SAM superfamily)